MDDGGDSKGPGQGRRVGGAGKEMGLAPSVGEGEGELTSVGMRKGPARRRWPNFRRGLSGATSRLLQECSSEHELSTAGISSITTG